MAAAADAFWRRRCGRMMISALRDLAGTRCRSHLAASFSRRSALLRGLVVLRSHVHSAREARRTMDVCAMHARRKLLHNCCRCWRAVASARRAARTTGVAVAAAQRRAHLSRAVRWWRVALARRAVCAAHRCAADALYARLLKRRALRCLARAAAIASARRRAAAALLSIIGAGHVRRVWERWACVTQLARRATAAEIVAHGHARRALLARAWTAVVSFASQSRAKAMSHSVANSVARRHRLRCAFTMFALNAARARKGRAAGALRSRQLLRFACARLRQAAVRAAIVEDELEARAVFAAGRLAASTLCRWRAWARRQTDLRTRCVCLRSVSMVPSVCCVRCGAAQCRGSPREPSHAAVSARHHAVAHPCVTRQDYADGVVRVLVASSRCRIEACARRAAA